MTLHVVIQAACVCKGEDLDTDGNIISRFEDD